MKVFLLHEIHYNYDELNIDWYNVYTFKKKDTALEYISNELNEPLENITNYFKDNNKKNSGSYTYKIEESEVV